MRRIAVYGGSFDPPHKGHKLLAQNLAEICGAEKVIIIPTALSPFKETSGATAADRYEMCRLAFNEPLFEVSDIEINRGGKSYTVDTVAEVKKLYPDAQIYLFMGDDMFLSFDRWYEYEKIAEMCVLVTACRTLDIEKLGKMKDYSENVLGLYENRVIFSESTPIEISSTEIRNNIKRGSFAYIDDSVSQYIRTRGLYL